MTLFYAILITVLLAAIFAGGWSLYLRVSHLRSRKPVPIRIPRKEQGRGRVNQKY